MPPYSRAVSVTTRFAPSPTGRLHLGHGVSAWLNHELARRAGGRFELRIEDIDPGRARPEFADGIAEDLRWLGLDWDGPVRRQSARLDAYAAALERLRGAGLVYPCFCTRREVEAEIARSAAAPHGPETPYPGTCRHLSAAERNRHADRPRAWRLDMGVAVARAGPLDFAEAGGRVDADPKPAGDVVLARKDAPASYHLAVVIDDAAQAITHVVRGEDLRAATHVHRLLQALLGLPTPAYHHHALVTGADGERLAKRHGAPTLAALREAGLAADMVRRDIVRLAEPMLGAILAGTALTP